MTKTLLHNLLSPLEFYLEQTGVHELSINQPHEVWLEKGNNIKRQTSDKLTLRYLKDLANQIAIHTEQGISSEHPLLSAYLPGGYRIQIVLPPAVHESKIGLSIRKPHLVDCDLAWQEQQGAFSALQNNKAHDAQALLKKAIQDCYQQKKYKDFLSMAVKNKFNILISGGTSTGKTTFLNALLKEIPLHERLITIEDVPEIRLIQPNHLALFASRNQQGRAKINTQDLVEASLRLRPHRIIMGELRSTEAFSFLRAVNTGHPGSIATLHANTPELAVEQLALMVIQKNTSLTYEQIKTYIRSIIDIIVQLQRDETGHRYVSDVCLLSKFFMQNTG